MVKVLDIFEFFQKYSIRKKHTKINREVLHKIVLIYDKNKEHINKNESKKITISQKINSLFDVIAILEKKKWSYQLYNNNHNHNPILASVYPAYKKVL